ncbi:MAG: hypothetical protein GY768_13300 [Planctomycetaceae bacterium]|nr:hypothetical protein [Planctomycetaceae bacterium]
MSAAVEKRPGAHAYLIRLQYVPVSIRTFCLLIDNRLNEIQAGESHDLKVAWQELVERA